MASGIRNSCFVILFLSEGVLSRPFVQFEMSEAQSAGKRVILVHESDPRHHPFDFAKEVAEAPPFMQEVVANHESLPWQRRDFMRQAVLDKLTTTVGFPKDWMPDLGSEGRAAGMECEAA